MLILAFDTSNSFASVSIAEENKILYAKKSEKANSQAENLILMIEEALTSLKLNYSDIKYLAVSQGPGSFTGIRIALAAAKGILLAAQHIIPVCINNFQMINYRIREQYRLFDYAISSVNAYREELYIQIFTKKGEYEAPMLVSQEEAKKIIENLRGSIALGGSGLHFLYNTEKPYSPNLIILPRFAYPDARIICKIAHQHIVQQRINNIIEPLYIRLPDAKLPQTKLDKK